MNNSIKKQILYGLIKNENYSRRVMPCNKSEYFSGDDKVIFDTTRSFVEKYNKLPAIDALIIDIDARTNISEQDANVSQDVLENWQKAPPSL